MSELAATAALLHAIARVADADGELGRKLTEIRADEVRRPGQGLSRPEKYTEVFTGLPGTGGAGARTCLSARRSDQSKIIWCVEFWIDTWGDDESWSAIVKGEVETDLGPDTDTETATECADRQSSDPETDTRRTWSPVIGVA